MSAGRTASIAAFKKVHLAGIRKPASLSRLLMLGCRGAKAFTYPTLEGTNVVLSECPIITIPAAYVEAAHTFAASESQWRFDNPEKVQKGAAITTEMQMKMNTFAKMSATLMYSFWKGLPEAMYHIDGSRPCCIQTIAPSSFVDCQNRVTRMVFKTCEDYLRVQDWYRDESGEFTTAAHLEMLRDSVVRMQSNNRSHKTRAGQGKAGSDANWGGHGQGEEKRFVEPTNEECPIDDDYLRQNALLGNDLHRHHQ